MATTGLASFQEGGSFRDIPAMIDRVVTDISALDSASPKFLPASKEATGISVYMTELRRGLVWEGRLFTVAPQF